MKEKLRCTEDKLQNAKDSHAEELCQFELRLKLESSCLNSTEQMHAMTKRRLEDLYKTLQLKDKMLQVDHVKTSISALKEEVSQLKEKRSKERSSEKWPISAVKKLNNSLEPRTIELETAFAILSLLILVLMIQNMFVN